MVLESSYDQCFYEMMIVAALTRNTHTLSIPLAKMPDIREIYFSCFILTRIGVLFPAQSVMRLRFPTS